MLDFEHLPANLDVDCDSICRRRQSTVGVFGLLLQGARNGEADRVIPNAFHYGCACSSEEGAAHRGSFVLEESSEPLHEFAPAIGREILLRIHQTLTIALVIIQCSWDDLLHE